MVTIPKTVGLMLSGFLLCLGLSSTAQADNKPSASDVMKTDSVTDRTGFQADESKLEKGVKATKTIKGVVLRIKGKNYFVKGEDSKEVRVHVGKTTHVMGKIKPGDRVEARVTDKNHALTIRLAQGTDADHEPLSGRDSLHETDVEHDQHSQPHD